MCSTFKNVVYLMLFALLSSWCIEGNAFIVNTLVEDPPFDFPFAETTWEANNSNVTVTEGTGISNSNAAEWTGNAILSQVIATDPGTVYDLQYSLAQSGDMNSITLYDVSVEGTTLGKITLDSGSILTDVGSPWTAPILTSFTASDSTTTFAIELSSYVDGNFFADNVFITQAVPEPSSLALGLFAFGGLYFVRRKKSKKS